MKLQNSSNSKVAMLAVAFLIVAGLPALMFGQDTQQQPQRTPAVEDWSTHHSVFSDPGDFSQGTQTRSFDDWYKIQNNPRFNFAKAKRRADRARNLRGGNNSYSHSNDNVTATEDAATPTLSSFTPLLSKGPKPPGKPAKPAKPQGDWNIFLGGTASAGLNLNNYPAKYSFDINAAPSCSADYVVVPVNKATAAASNATGTITVGSSFCAAPGDGVTVNGFAVTTNATASTGTITYSSAPSNFNTTVVSGTTYNWRTTCTGVNNCMVVSATTSTDATELRNAINGTCQGNACAANTTVTATSSGSVVTLTSICAGATAIVVTGTGTFVNTTGSAGTTTTTHFALGSNTTTATNIATALTTNTASTLVTAAAASGVATLTPNATGAAGNGITIANTFNSGVTLSGANTAGGVDGQATVVAYNNLYDAQGGTATQTGTLAANVIIPGDGSSITINGVVLTASDPTAASRNGTFTGQPTAGQTVTITNGSNVISLTAGGVTNTGTITVGSRPNTTDTFTVGTQTYTFSSACGTTAFCVDRAFGDTTAHYAGNIAAAIMASASLCTSSGSGTGACYGSATTANARATATVSGSVVTVTNTFTSAITFTESSTTLTVSPSGGTIPLASSGNTCAGSAPSFNGGFDLNASTTIQAANLAAAIAACPTAAGVDATSAAAVVTATARTAGTSGNSITLAETLSNFSWAGSPMTGGADGTTSGTHFAYWSGSTNASTLVLGTNMASAINTNTATTGVTAAITGTTTVTFTLTANSPGTAGNSIATLDNITSFAWAGGTLAGGLDDGLCGTGQPTVLWAYDVSTAAANSPMMGSPILSLDGKKVAFIESASTGAILHVLHPGTTSGNFGDTTLIGTPTAPTIITTLPNWTTCLSGATACMFNLTLGSNNNTNSPPFYDYLSDDAIYVGDDGGRLWKVINVFNGAALPSISASPWNAGVLVHTGNKLTGPVYDYANNNIIVADAGGQVSRVSQAGALSGTTVTGLGVITDPPVVDSSTNKVLIFSGGSGSASVVTQRDTTLGTGNVSVTVGSNTSAGSQIHAGIFDDTYYNSVNGTGTLYVCGKGTSTASGPVLYNIALTSGTLAGTTSSSLALTTSTTTAGQCSPLSEIKNNSTDWLFVGIPANCAFSGSATGCIMAFDISSTFPTTANATGAENGGTSGIVADNVSATTGASSVYFTTLTNPGAGGCTGEPSTDSSNCFVKRTQNGLN